MPGDSGVLVVTRVRSTNKSAHEAAGALGIRHSPRPLKGGRFINGSGALRGEGVNARLLFDNLQSSCVVPANAGTHTPCHLCFARWSIPSVTTNAGGYGSRPSP